MLELLFCQVSLQWVATAAQAQLQYPKWSQAPRPQISMDQMVGILRLPAKSLENKLKQALDGWNKL